MVMAYPLEYKSLWAVVIRSKYGEAENRWTAANIKKSSPGCPCKGTAQLLPIFRPLTKLSLGCGNIIRFWVDPWISSTPLYSQLVIFSISSILKEYTRAFTLPLLNGIYIFERILEIPNFRNIWNFQLSSNNFQPSVTRTNSRMWTISPSDTLSVPSFFSAISSNPVASPSPFPPLSLSLSPYKVQGFFLDNCMEPWPYFRCYPILLPSPHPLT